MPLLGASEVDSVATFPLGWACRREKKVRRVGRPTTASSMSMKW